MPDLKISQLPVATTPLAGTELVPIVQGGITEQTTVQAIMTSTVPSGTANGVLYLNASKVATSGSALTFDGTTLTTNTVRLGNASGLQWADGSSYIAGTGPSGVMLFAVANAEQMRLTSTGLGIGTSSPAGKLQISSNNPEVYITDNSVSAPDSAALYLGIGAVSQYSGLIADFSNDRLNIRHNQATRATFDSSGNLGLGVTPSAWGVNTRALQMGDYAALNSDTANGAANVSMNAFFDGTNWIYRNSPWPASYYNQTNGQHRWFTAPSGTAGNTISFTQAMTLDASGRLGIGLTNPAYRLDVEISAGPYVARFRNSSTSTSEYNVALFVQGAAGAAIGYIGTGGSAVGNAAFANNFVVGTQTSSALVFNTADTERARITSTGNVVAGGSAALATTATDGFLYVPTCAGTPTGTPTAITGMAPIVVDTTNNKMYFYSGGAWRDAGP